MAQPFLLTHLDTLISLVSILPFMDTQVVQEKLVVTDRQPTDRTRRPPAVDLLVAPQSSRTREALPTDAAAVGFLPGVTPHVRLHVLERLPTDLTGPPSFPVRLEMVQELLGALTALATHPTEAPWARLHVVQQIPVVTETLWNRSRRLRPPSCDL